MLFKKIVLASALAISSLTLANGRLNEYNQTREKLEDILQNHSLVVLDFWAPWCPPCRALTPLLEQFAKANPDIYIIKINIDSYKSLLTAYGISSIPTLILFKDGKRIATKTGKPSSLRFIRDAFNK